jgi:hypothetical protein
MREQAGGWGAMPHPLGVRACLLKRPPRSRGRASFSDVFAASSLARGGIDFDGSTASGCPTFRRGLSPSGSPRPGSARSDGTATAAARSSRKPGRRTSPARSGPPSIGSGHLQRLHVPAELDQFAGALGTKARRRDHYPVARQISRKGPPAGSRRSTLSIAPTHAPPRSSGLGR